MKQDYHDYCYCSIFTKSRLQTCLKIGKIAMINGNYISRYWTIIAPYTIIVDNKNCMTSIIVKENITVITYVGKTG